MARAAKHHANIRQLRKYISEELFPASKRELIDNALDENAPDEVVSFLHVIEDREYDSPEDVIEQVDQVDGLTDEQMHEAMYEELSEEPEAELEEEQEYRRTQMTEDVDEEENVEEDEEERY